MKQATIITRKPRARTFDNRNHRVTVHVGDTVKTAWGRGQIKLISDDGLLHVKVNDPKMAEHGRIVTVRTVR